MSSEAIRVGLLAYGLDRPVTGIGRYATEIAKAISADHPDIQIVLLVPFSQPVRGLENLPSVKVRGTRLLPAMMVFGPVQLEFLAKRHRLDIIHDPVGIAPFLPRVSARTKRIVTIHDAVPFVHPETHAHLTNFLFHKYLPYTLKFTDRIVTVSDSSSDDIERFLRVDRSRIVRIHCGVSDRFCPQTHDAIHAICQRYQLRPPYILAVGALQARKNTEEVLDAYASLREQGLPHRLVLVGPKSWKSEGVFQKIALLGLGEHVHLTGYVDDLDLPGIYAGADCFVFPSLYEGFGFPPLEAMACGTPVVVSNRSSLPEVVGDAGLLVDAQDHRALAVAIRQVLTQPAVAHELRQRGLVRSKRFTWERSAAAHASLYRDIVSGHTKRLAVNV